MKQALLIMSMILLLGFGFMIHLKKDPEFNNIDVEMASIEQVQALSVSVSEIAEIKLEEEQLSVIFNLHEQLLNAHQTLVQKHQDFRLLREEFQTIRQHFRSLDVRLNREDGVTLWYYYNDLLDLKQSFEATHGLAYQKLVDLKGSYTIENYDLIVQTFEDVLLVLNHRIDLLNQGIHIFNQSISIYQIYIN